MTLAGFKANPANKGKVMQSGLWRYTRHPNYFGDTTVWWGYFVVEAGTVVKAGASDSAPMPQSSGWGRAPTWSAQPSNHEPVTA